jgi:hypothetical protein
MLSTLLRCLSGGTVHAPFGALLRSGDARPLFANREQIHVQERLRVGGLECLPGVKIGERIFARVLPAELLDDLRIELKAEKRPGMI